MNMCDECGKRFANIHLTQIVNDETTVMHLCDECARKKGIEINVEDVKPSKDNGEDEKYKDLKCSKCGLKYLDFKAKGWLGCARCFEAFEKQINELLIRVHGCAVHKGKRYVKVGGVANDKKVGDVAQLRRQLQRAIKNEEFELAAKLRDAIHSLTANEKNHE